jgi:23S rRNA (pseudouridine1915-N3)-methyltransferase
LRIVVCAVGRARRDPARALFEHYSGLLRWPFELKEFEERRKLPREQLRARECEMLLDGVPAGAVVVALDEAGQALASRTLAGRIGRWRDDGRGCIAFLVGGADGLNDAVRARADLVLSFGKATWPHMLARAMLAEQLYRAQQILAGHPYHRD